MSGARTTGRRLALLVLSLGLAAPAALAQSQQIPAGLLTGQAAKVVINQPNFSDITFGTDNEHWGAISGFAIASLAVIWRFLFYRREILGAVREGDGERRLVVAGRSEFYKSLAEDEYTALFEKLFDINRRKNL